MFCKNCGSQIPEGVNFCPGCGTPVAIDPTRSASAGAQPEQDIQQNSSVSQGAEQTQGFTESQRFESGEAYGGTAYQGYDPNAYQQPYSGTTYGGAPIQSRSIALCIILSIVTCGIYGIYWLIVLVNDLNIATEEPNETSGGMVFLFSLITCSIYEIYWMYKAGNRLDDLKVRLGRQRESRGIVYLLLSIFGLSIVAFALIQNELNKIAEGTY